MRKGYAVFWVKWSAFGFSFLIFAKAKKKKGIQKQIKKMQNYVEEIKRTFRGNSKRSKFKGTKLFNENTIER